MKFSNLGSLSFEAFLLWKSAPVKFSKELSLPLRKDVILPTAIEARDITFATEPQEN